MVLQSFSWQDFMLAAVVFLLLWYGAVWWFYGRRRSAAGSDTLPLPHGWQDGVDDLSELIGKPVPDRGVSVVEAEDFGFGTGGSGVETSDQLGLIPDVKQEIRSICALLAQQDGTKEDFFLMFELVRDKYPAVPQAALAGLNGFIREHVPFALSEQELEELWS